MVALTVSVGLESEQAVCIESALNSHHHLACLMVELLNLFGYRWTRILPLHGCAFWFIPERMNSSLITLAILLNMSSHSATWLQLYSKSSPIWVILCSGFISLWTHLVQMHLVHKNCVAGISDSPAYVHLSTASKFDCIQIVSLGCRCFQNYTKRQHITPHHATLCHTPHHSVPHDTTLRFTTPHCTTWRHTTPHYTVPHDTTLHSLSGWP